MRLVLIIVVIGCITASPSPQGPSTDPCTDSPCGKGAECKSMGSIAICVCPNDGPGDPFVSCMEQVDAETGSLSSSASKSPTTTPANIIKNNFVTSFDVGSVHEQPRGAPTPITTTTSKPSTTSPSTTTTPRRQPVIITSSTTTTTTKSPYVHVFETSTSRPATIGHGSHNSNNNKDHYNQPESHRIPIITHEPNNNNYPSHHDNLPSPISGSSTSSPNYSYHGSIGSGSLGTTYDPFNEKSVTPGSGPIADYGTSNYRGTSSHLSGSSHAYDNRFPVHTAHDAYGGTFSKYPDSYTDRYGHHGHHPTSSGFPDPITESPSSFSRYDHSNRDSSYDVYNYNRIRNDFPSHHGSAGGYDRISDPLGKYDNCRTVNGIIVCADNHQAGGYRHHEHHHHHTPHHSHNPPPLRDRDDMRTTTYSYSLHSSRDRDHHYSSYYPNHDSFSTSIRPISGHNFHVNRQGYPYDHYQNNYHDSDPIGSTSSSYHPHSFLPKEQRIAAASVLTISSADSSSTTTNVNHHHTQGHHQDRYDSSNPLCKSMCGINSICRLVLERPVCGCPDGHTGDPSVHCTPIFESSTGRVSSGAFASEGSGGNSYGTEECQRHVDCKQHEICAKSKCIDPCKEQGLISSSSVNFIGIGGNDGGGAAGSEGVPSICGRNAECLVVGHTPVCKCHQNYFGNPYVACVP